VGLADFGKPANYAVRQIDRWSKQYKAAQTAVVPAMDRLMEWLPANVPTDDTTAIVHGDYRLANVMLHQAEPRIIAVLDWELATLGHPLADVAYFCMNYHMASAGELRDPASGIPCEREFVEAYCLYAGRGDLPDWPFWLAFSFFRLASISQGVYARGLQGNAADPSAMDYADRARQLAEIGWKQTAAHRRSLTPREQ
jgi:aminoglycoside phosphotransferase (APT) family kinase protein